MVYTPWFNHMSGAATLIPSMLRAGSSPALLDGGGGRTVVCVMQDCYLPAKERGLFKEVRIVAQPRVRLCDGAAKQLTEQPTKSGITRKG